MSDFITGQEASIRLGVFVGTLLLIALFEILVPRRVLTTSKVSRWFGNLGIVVINSVALRLLFPISAVQLAFWAGEKGWGLFNIMDFPYWLLVALSIILLDFIIYLQHVMFHAVPSLWRLHMMHHADLDYDLTTGIRFHPIEIIVSMGIKFSAIVLLGAPALAVVMFEILLNGMAMFNHGNFRIPTRPDNLLRRIVVTPDMHLVHHSIVRQESNHNFGFNLSWWDRLFGTYQAEPEAGREGMIIGLTGFLDVRYARFGKMILNPFEKGDGA